MASASIANLVTEIGDGAFAGCSSLANAIIPNSVMVPHTGYSNIDRCSHTRKKQKVEAWLIPRGCWSAPNFSEMEPNHWGAQKRISPASVSYLADTFSLPSRSRSICPQSPNPAKANFSGSTTLFKGSKAYPLYHVRPRLVSSGFGRCSVG